jgi:hypothetical protein
MGNVIGGMFDVNKKAYYLTDYIPLQARRCREACRLIIIKIGRWRAGYDFLGVPFDPVDQLLDFVDGLFGIKHLVAPRALEGGYIIDYEREVFLADSIGTFTVNKSAAAIAIHGMLPSLKFAIRIVFICYGIRVVYYGKRHQRNSNVKI